MDVAAAVADPVRRRIMALLDGRTMSAGDIAASFDISRPAVSRHLRVLRDCGLVVGEVRGRQRLYRLEVAPLAPLVAWLDQFRDRLPDQAREPRPDPWPSRLDALDTEVHRTRRERERRAPTPIPKENTA
ncbi:MAG TPA: metalloregulator ArsR/SmtB family transcription factor [Acidimicrobiales bacterium]